jgi:hypothetical protein
MMLRTPILLVALCAANALGAEETAPAMSPAAPPPKAAPAAEATQQLNALLPPLPPPGTVTAPPLAPGPVTTTAKPGEGPNPDVLVLPKVTVKPRPRPRLNDNTILGPEAFNEQLAKEKFNSFDRNFLNKFSIFGMTPEQRAREEYDREKKAELQSDVEHMAQVREVVDPAQAKVLRDAAAKP